MKSGHLLSTVAAVAVAGAGFAAYAAPTTPERLLNAGNEPQNWLMTLSNYSNWNYSKLSQINKSNVANLKVVFMASIGGNALSKIAGSVGNEMAAPLVEALYPMPKSALIPVTAVWLGFGDGSKILLIFLGCMLPVTLGAFNGARGCDRQLVWSARSLGASRLRILWDVVVPSALPELLNGVRTALALSFVLLVSAELIVAQSGFGYLIGFLGEGGTYDGMFAVVLVVAFLGFFADRLYQVFMDRVLAWQR